MKQVIHIFGAAGSGTSTLGRCLSAELGYRFMDTDDYFWMPTDPKFTVRRPREQRLERMRRDIASAENAVISGSLTGWGDPLIPLFTLGVRLATDKQTRISRIRQRERQKFGSRIEMGGDLYRQHQEFLAWADAYDTGGPGMRSRVVHDQWQMRLSCPPLVLDSSMEAKINVEEIKKFLR